MVTDGKGVILLDTPDKCKPRFESIFPPQQIRDILSQNNGDYAETVAFRLVDGCIKLEATILHLNGVNLLGYDVFVKSIPTDDEWIAYDMLTQPVNIDAPDMEQEMRRVLADYLKESGLSCRENKFEDVTEKESNGYE